MPGPGRGDDEVAGAHGGALAIDRRVGAASLDDEAQRGLGVAVAGRDLAGQDQLQAGVQALRDAGLAGQAGVLQDQHAAHGFLGADQRAGGHDVGAHVLVLPDGGHAARRGLARHQVVQRLPIAGPCASWRCARNRRRDPRRRCGCPACLSPGRAGSSRLLLGTVAAGRGPDGGDDYAQAAMCFEMKLSYYPYEEIYTSGTSKGLAWTGPTGCACAT